MNDREFTDAMPADAERRSVRDEIDQLRQQLRERAKVAQEQGEAINDLREQLERLRAAVG